MNIITIQSLRRDTGMENIRYHYTSVDGMSSILKNKKLRLTRSEFLNDPADCRVLYTLIGEYLDKNCEKIMAQLDSDEVQQTYNKATLIDYIYFLQDHIHLYVLSLTDNNDQMSMWNYYGSGGMQLSVDVDDLVNQLSNSFSAENLYLAFSPVKYISDGDSVESIAFEPFSNFHLNNKDHQHIFWANSKKKGQNGQPHRLYETTILADFVDTYIKGYIESLKYLIKQGDISSSSSRTEIYEAVYLNTNSLDNYLVFKRDLTLYLMVLSAFLKNDTYSYEKEYRIVIFENALSQSFCIDYAVQSIQNQKYMRPYWETTELSLDFLKGITLSPLTKNLPIDGELYMDTIRGFIQKNTGNIISVNCSSHKIRW